MIELAEFPYIHIRYPEVVSHIQKISGVPQIIFAFNELAQVVLPCVKSGIKNISEP